MKIKAHTRRTTAALLVACMILPQTLWAASGGPVDENPNGFAMVADLLVARPVGLVLTVGGAGIWLVSLPFTLLAGNVNEAAETLVLGPGEQTFMRCLGCRQSGYTNRDVEQYEKYDEQKTAQVDDYDQY